MMAEDGNELRNPLIGDGEHVHSSHQHSAAHGGGPLKILIYASGTRGDVQPYCLLAREFMSMGYTVKVCTEQRMEKVVREFDVDYAPLAGDPAGLIFQPEAQPVLESGSMMKLIKLTEAWEKKFSKDDILASYLTAASSFADGSADIIIGTALTMLMAYCVSEKVGCTWIPVLLGPTLPTSEFPLWALKGLLPSSCLNKWSYHLAFKMLWKSESKWVNAWRTNVLGLGPLTGPMGVLDVVTRLQPPVIIAGSQLLCGPKGRKPMDYPDNAHIVGFYFHTLPSDYSPPAGLQDFLEKPSSKRSVYLGFGSMPMSDPLKLVALILDTMKRADCRALLLVGWSGLDSVEAMTAMQDAVDDGDLFITKAVPHDYLFPKMDCIVHHCGVGTMASALRSGRPQIPCPFMLDQPHNAQLILGLGCAPCCIPYSSLTSIKLSKALGDVFENKKQIYSVCQKVKERILEESRQSLAFSVDMMLGYHQTVVKKLA